ncbi:MAG: RNA polymerase sigma-54 factor [Anaerolineales bacterium]
MLQIQDHSLRHVATAHLAQTMSLLALSNQELQDKVLEELAENPALELLEDLVCPTCKKRLPAHGPCPKCSSPQADEDSVVFISPRDGGGSLRYEDDTEELEPAAPESLALHVLEQLAAGLEAEDRPIAAYILSSLDDDGFLPDAPALLARELRAPLERIKRVIDQIAHVDPAGLGTSGPRAALLAQLDLLRPDDPQVILSRQILETEFERLARHDFQTIANDFDVSVAKVRKAAAFIQEKLNPYPARAFWGSGRSPAGADPNVYHSPDILITHRSEGPLIVEIFSSMPGWLRVNPHFRKALSDADENHSEEWKKHLERAALFVKCLQQRNNTMRRLMEDLVENQRHFILEGDRHLQPMTRAKLAERLGVHESTISRAVANKGVALPDGRIVPLARFFDRSLSVRDRIKEIVKFEKKPLTDDQIAALLRRQGVKIARRTVAKYRTIEGILPARLRKPQEATA